MSTKLTQPRTKKGEPIPIRFDAPEEAFIAKLVELTGLKQAEIIRRAGRFAFPKFISRGVNILDQVPP